MYRSVGEACCNRLQDKGIPNMENSFLLFSASCTLKMEATRSSEKSLNRHQNARRNIPEDSTFRSHRRGKNLVSQNLTPMGMMETTFHRQERWVRKTRKQQK
jgi:hypothetical protein